MVCALINNLATANARLQFQNRSNSKQKPYQRHAYNHSRHCIGRFSVSSLTSSINSRYQATFTVTSPSLSTSSHSRTATTCQASHHHTPSKDSRNIAIAIDTSPDSRYACQWTLENIVRAGDTVHLLHCLPTLPRQGLYTLPDGRLVVIDYDKLMATEEEYIKSSERVIEKTVYNVFHPAKVPYVVHLLREDPYTGGDKGVIARDLCMKAADLQAAALIISSKTRSQMSELFLGSVANFATHSSSQPVLVLHAPQPETPTQAAISSGSKGIARWLGELLSLTHPETKGTAAEAVVEQAASGVSTAAHKHDARGVVTSADFPPAEKESNLVGQGVGGLDTTLDSSSASSMDVSSSLSEGETNVIGQAVGLEDELSTASVAAAFNASSPSDTEPTATTTSATKSTNGGRTIMVAVDDTEASERACRWAVEHLYKAGDDLHFIHVVPSMPRVAYSAAPNFSGGESFALLLEPPSENTKSEVETLLQQRFAPLLKEKGVPYTSDVLLEPTEDSVSGVGRAICNRAKECGADVVVLGSHMKGGLQEFLLGSVAQWTAHHCKAPVAVLH